MIKPGFIIFQPVAVSVSAIVREKMSICGKRLAESSIPSSGSRIQDLGLS
jgi:hypothetical protein